MEISQNGLDFIEKWEGKRYNKYKDAAGLWTVGIGHLIKPGEVFDHTLTDDECYELLMQDLAPVQSRINRWVEVPLTQNQYDALCSLVLNIGTGNKNKGFFSSSVLRYLNQGHYEDAADAFLMWNKMTLPSGDKVKSPGLANRRRDERKLFLSEET